MGKWNLVGPSYTSQSLNADCQRTVNLYPEVVESGTGNSNIVLYPSPGTKEFVEIVPPAPPAGPAGLQNARITLTAAQINQAANAGGTLQLIAAPGPNLLIVPLSLTVQYVFVSSPYLGTAGIEPRIGFGTSETDITTSTWIQDVGNILFSKTFSTICQFQALPSFANNPPSKFVNQPLAWADSTSEFGGNDGTGDGTAIIHIQYYVLNVVTGAIVNGQPKRIFSAKVELSAAQVKTASSVPIQLIAAPGANKVLVPLSAVIWHHFITTPFNLNPLSVGGYGTVVADIINSPIFHSFNSNGFRVSADSMEQQNTNSTNTGFTNPTANVINKPLAWANKSDVSAAAGDTTATVYLQWLVIDTVTGELLEGGGDYFNSITQLSAAQLKTANTVAPSLAAAPGPGLIHVPQYGVCQAHYVTTPYLSGNGGVPNPRVNPGPTTPPYITALMSFFTSGGPFTLWSDTQDQMLLACCNFYLPPNGNPGSEVPPTQVINQPISWGNFGDISASTADGTATVNCGYVTLNTGTGNVVVAT